MFTCGPIILVNSAGPPPPGTTWDPSNKGPSITLSNGNLTAGVPSGFQWNSAKAVASDNSGIRYMEIHLDAVDGTTGGIIFGIGTSSASNTSFCGADAFGYGWQMTTTGTLYHNGTVGNYGGAPHVVGDVIGMSYNFSTGTLIYYVNGVSQGNAFTGIGAATFFPMISLLESTCQITARFSSSSWTNSPGGVSQW